MSLISDENKAVLVERLKEFGITLGFMIVATGADFAAKNLGLFTIDPALAAFIGTLLGQVMSWAETHYMIAGAIKRIAKAIRPKHRG